VIIRKTVWEFKRQRPSFDEARTENTHSEVVLREVWWFLFIPLYTRDSIRTSNL
jgi:hypothetical protein